MVADFRRRDIALGGEGAPLAPAFHNQVFRTQQCNRAIINIGGIANITGLAADPGQPVSGFEYDKVRALLAYLAVESDRPHRRETLAGLLWHEKSERDARHDLSQALYDLLIDPLPAAVKEGAAGRRLYIVPHGPLHYHPLHLIGTPGSILADDFAVTYLPNLYLLARRGGAEMPGGASVAGRRLAPELDQLEDVGLPLEVLAVGKGKILDSGEVRPLDVKVGDKVLFGKYSGTEVKVDGEDLLVMREEDIMAVVES